MTVRRVAYYCISLLLVSPISISDRKIKHESSRRESLGSAISKYKTDVVKDGNFLFSSLREIIE